MTTVTTTLPTSSPRLLPTTSSLTTGTGKFVIPPSYLPRFLLAPKWESQYIVNIIRVSVFLSSHHDFCLVCRIVLALEDENESIRGCFFWHHLFCRLSSIRAKSLQAFPFLSVISIQVTSKCTRKPWLVKKQKDKNARPCPRCLISFLLETTKADTT